MSEKETLLIVDFDQPVYVAAGFCQTNYDYIDKETNENVGSFTTQKSFKESLQDGDSPSNYEMVRIVKPIEPKDEDTPAEAIGYHNLKKFVAKLETLQWVDDYRLVIHGEGNFREDVATIQEYKGNRKEKPLFVLEMKEYVKNKWPDKVIVATEEESDDVVGRWGWDCFYGATDCQVVMGHVDKDIDQVPGLHWNYDKDERYQVTLMEGAASFWKQTLTGDSTDNIPGLPKLTKEFKKEYGLKTNAGFGKKTADAYIDPCTTPKEMAERVVVAYKSGYGDDWLNKLDEVGKLLFMNKKKGVLWSARETLDRMGVDYG